MSLIVTDVRKEYPTRGGPLAVLGGAFSMSRWQRARR